jgi:RNA polymerase sigma factor (sigma-70 family)
MGRAETAPLTPDQLLDTFVALRPRLLRVIANRVGDADTAADLIQEMYLRLPKIAVPLATAGDANAYLLRMAINAALNHLKIEGRRAELLAGVTELYDVPERSPEDIVLVADEVRAVDSALRELPEKCRQMLYMSRVEGMTHAEIARQLGVSQSLVEKYLVKAILHCRSQLP